jgi:hypothetical protein
LSKPESIISKTEYDGEFLRKLNKLEAGVQRKRKEREREISGRKEGSKKMSVDRKE